MAERTNKEVKKNIKRLRKLWKTYSGRIVSLEDFAQRLNVTEKQLNNIFKNMEAESNEEVEQIKAEIKPLTRKLEKLKNYKTFYLPTYTQLGIKQQNAKRRGIFIKPLSLHTILEDGICNPRKDDILYIAERYDRKIRFYKFLVLGVETRKKNRKVSVLVISKLFFSEEDEKDIRGLGYSETFDGIDYYIMSKI